MFQLINKLSSITSSVYKPLCSTSTNLIGAACVGIRERSTKPGRLRPRRKQKCKFRGILTPDSCFVTSGTQLVKQMGIVYMPGLNVGIGRDFTLHALEHGRVFVTTEEVDPKWSSGHVQRFFSDYKDTGIPLYKTYLHVVPTPMPQNFKLLEQI